VIVCSCHAVTDRAIRAALRAGRLDLCRAGTGCGGCTALVDSIVHETQARPVEVETRRSSADEPAMVPVEPLR
jgi:bacterioferritin-associated ferredoxin